MEDGVLWDGEEGNIALVKYEEEIFLSCDDTFYSEVLSQTDVDELAKIFFNLAGMTTRRLLRRSG